MYSLVLVCYLRAKIQNRVATDQRYYTDPCRAMLSVRTFLDQKSDVSSARGKFIVGRKSRLFSKAILFQTE